MSKKKKIIILSCMVLLLAVTAVFNFVLSGSNQAVDQPITTATYFAQYKSERTQSRTEQLVQLNEIISADANNDDAKNDALELKLKLTEIIEQELLLETLIESRGYEEAVVSIGLTSDYVNVMIKDDDFTQDDAVIIYSILAEEAAASPENVTIIPIS